MKLEAIHVKPKFITKSKFKISIQVSFINDSFDKLFKLCEFSRLFL